MIRTAPAAAAALATLLACSLAGAQTAAVFEDRANLGGERIEPRTGRELPLDQNTLGLQQMLRRIATRSSLLLIVAHPDDEDGGMLTWYSRGFGARCGVLTLTRGEGGQNAMTADFEDALGLLRTQELLSADRYSGVTQMFGTEVDFGFSKTKAEAFRKWTHERVLYDAVRAVRIFRPVVIAAVFSGSVTDGHGQHQVSGQIAQEVFKAAADPSVFPELTREGIYPWAAQKVYERVPMQAISDKGLFDYATGQYVPAQFTNYITGETTAQPPHADVTVPEGETDPLLTPAAANPSDVGTRKLDPGAPLSYVQFARIGLGLQRSQIGPGVRNAPPGKFDVAYHRYGSRLGFQPVYEVNFFDAIDVTLNGMVTVAPDLPSAIRNHIAELAVKAASLEPEFRRRGGNAAGMAPTLAADLQFVDSILASVDAAHLPDDQRAGILHELRIKRVQINDALALALGLSFDATTRGSDQTTGSEIPVWTSLRTSADGASLTVLNERLENARGRSQDADRPSEQKADFTATHPIERMLKAPAALTGTVTRPYFTRDNIEQPVYRLLDPSLRNAPASPPALTAFATVEYRGVRIELARVIHDGAQPLRLIPPAGIALAPHAQVMPAAETAVRFTTTVFPAPAARGGSPAEAVTPRITAPRGWKPTLAGAPADDPPGEALFRLSAPAGARSPVTVSATALTRAAHFSEGFRAIGYGDLPRTNYFTPATSRVVPVSLKLPPANRRRIGYLPGTGDAIPEALASIGLTVTPLTVADLTAAGLAKFDTVILGVRTYNAHPDLHGAPTQALLEFARNGGNVVVQYQTMEFTGGDAPFPLSLGSNEKVVDETAPVRLLEGRNPLLSTPNAISSADFNGWVEERGHGFLSTWDNHYTALTETGDPGAPDEHILPQAPQRGGLITVSLGKGRWTYAAFALYRQLPEAVPGAFRLFVNLLSN